MSPEMTTRERVTLYLARHPLSTAQQMAFNLGVSTSTVRRYLRELDEKGELQQHPHWVSRFGYTRVYYLQDTFAP